MMPISNYVIPISKYYNLFYYDTVYLNNAYVCNSFYLVALVYPWTYN